MSARRNTKRVGGLVVLAARRNYSSHQLLQQTSIHYRSEFTKFFNHPINMGRANKATWHTVRTMNQEMERNNVPMSRAHYEVAIKSITQGDTICTDLTSENKHVLDSNGSGFVYNAGYQFHKVINYVDSSQCEGKV